ncbi:hypothetical protein Caci_2913 [Catenulispora acidiphila DSM 44928]|uniref:Uncharacterized protein n=1 Tax=Catenulispora acidiphila (strain DSM 44928 / JCM 14897 / NBRC 102108 / NRRL B-24433 / ID139908) TaxID=479433 RepID=C7Q2T0_CATAD|nr:hypothetical protein [Catenulispora acidiphila]ACU71822.1 hypothetical protein Caci_2913 [Catenulispora acidiphila DSM 44928]
MTEVREVTQCRHCRGPVKRDELHDHAGERNDCYAVWTCVNPNCQSSSDVAFMVCSGGDDATEEEA